MEIASQSAETVRATIAPRKNLGSLVARREFIGLRKFAFQLGCGFAHGGGVESKGRDLRAGVFKILFDFGDLFEENCVNLDSGGELLDSFGELCQLSRERLHGCPPRAYASCAEKELPRSNAELFEEVHFVAITCSSVGLSGINKGKRTSRTSVRTARKTLGLFVSRASEIS